MSGAGLPAASPPARWTPLNLALAALALLVAVATIFTLVRGPETPLVRDVLPKKSATAEEKVTLDYAAVDEAARAWTVKFLTVNYKEMDPLIKAVLSSSTDPFKKEYDRAQVNLKALVQDNLTVSTGKPVHVGVSEVSTDDAVVFVAADSSVKNKSTKDEFTKRYYRLKLTMVPKGEAWLVSQVEFVG